MLALNTRTATRLALFAAKTFPVHSANVAVLQRIPVRHEITLNPVTFGAQTSTVAVEARDARNIELTGGGVFPAHTSTVVVNLQGAPRLALQASKIFAAHTATVAVIWRAAMPPGMVMGLMLLEMGHVFLRIMWLQPDLGTGRLLYYEFRLNGGMWMSTMSPSTEYNITGLTPDTLYSIEVRAVTDVGMGSASAVLMARTAATTVPTVPQFVRADAPGGPFIDLTWNLPTDDGGAVIDRYDVLVTGPDGVAFPVESTGSAATNYRVRGLRLFQRYGFQVRAVNSIGPGPYSDIIYATPVGAEVGVAISGQRIPLLDLDRQSMIVRLGGMDCRIQVWWQPSDAAWYSGNRNADQYPVISGRRLVVGAGLLDRLPDVLPGNIVCRALDEDSGRVDPARDAWQRQTHGLVFETAT